jgi:hypothetical protein
MCRLFAGMIVMVAFWPSALALAHGSAPRESPSLVILPKTGPHILSDSSPVLTFFFHVRGIIMDRHVGSSDKPRHGHVQMYLDHVPRDAHIRKDLHGVAAYAAAYKLGSRYTVSIQFGSGWIKAHPGHHVLLVGLARNDFVMYPAKIQRFTVRIQ